LLCALAAVALWSTVATGFKLGLRYLEPLQLLFAGTLFSLAIFWVAAFASRQTRLPRPALPRALAFGVVNPFAYYIVLFEAYDRLPAQIAQPINYTWAIMLAILAVPILGQRLSRRTLGGILLSYAGVVVLLTQGRLDGLGGISWTGVALALVSTLLWAGYWLMGTRSADAPVGMMAWSFLFATPCAALACWLGPGLPTLRLETFTYGAWVGLVEMGATFLLWQRALRLTTNAGRTGQLIFLSPFLSLVLIGTILGEKIEVTSVIGLAIIVAGLLVTRTAVDELPKRDRGTRRSARD
jgi:drug/metabolite transporter (DMT)-like permease